MALLTAGRPRPRAARDVPSMKLLLLVLLSVAMFENANGGGRVAARGGPRARGAKRGKPAGDGAAAGGGGGGGINGNDSKDEFVPPGGSYQRSSSGLAVKPADGNLIQRDARGKMPPTSLHCVESKRQVSQK